jgi:pyruvate dehydrogenase E1 component alpha subunit
MSGNGALHRDVALTLGDLADSEHYREPIDITGRDPVLLLNSLRMMLTIRFCEETIGELARSGETRTPCHLGIGQEAIAVGVSSHLTSRDRVFGTHRSHSHFLAQGGGIYELIAEVLGRADGASRGMGGSMHLYGKSFGFYGSVPIVGATVPLSVGAGLAAKLDAYRAKRQGEPLPVGVCYFGDGTTEEGVVHESINLASALQVPVLFVCENNLYSSHLDIMQRQPFDRVARYAEIHNAVAMTIDGNDIGAVADAAAYLLGIARTKSCPVFLEAVTYRWRGHVGPAIDEDVGVRRSHDDLLSWMERDPVRRLTDAMVAAKLLSQTELEALQTGIRSDIQSALERARQAPTPRPEWLMDFVYMQNAEKLP